MKHVQILVLVALLSSVSANRAYSAPSQDAVLAFHQTFLSKSFPCNPTSYRGIQCSDYRTDISELVPSRLYFALARAEQIAGVSEFTFGLEYGVGTNWFVSATICSDLAFPSADWPQDGSGVRLVWDSQNCQQNVEGSDGVHAVGGFLYVYAYGSGSVEIVANPHASPPKLAFTDCLGNECLILNPGAKVETVPGEGFNPCETDTPVKLATWSSLKRLR